MDAAYERINEIIQSENSNGIPTNRIVIGTIIVGGIHETSNVVDRSQKTLFSEDNINLELTLNT